MSCEEIFVKQLRDRGLRYTPQREMVLQAVHEVQGQATAEEIYERVRHLSACVDISTIYRTLDLLQEFNLVAVIDLGNGQRRYEHLGAHGPHYHLLCRSCGQLFPLPEEEASRFRSALAASHGFAVDLDGVILPGLCRACLAAREDEAEAENTLSRGAEK